MMSQAFHDSFLAACTPERAIWHARNAGEPIPEKYRPGYLLTQLSQEDRDALKNFTSDMACSYRYPGM